MIYIDTHAHLNFNAFDLDFTEVIERAKAAGVGKIIIPSSNLKTSKKAIEIAETVEGVYAAVGLHPIHVKPSTSLGSGDETYDDGEYLKLAQNKKVVAIGEIGLDYYYDKSNSADQKEVLVKLIRLAQRVSKPIILHSRDAADDLLPILMAETDLPKGVMHCFQEDWQFAQAVIGMGFSLSFTGLITFSKNQKTLEVIRETPLEKILIETDSPYMTPDPYRGKRNEPAYVIEVARKIAEIKKIPLEKVAEQTSKNAAELFGIDI